MSRSEYLSTLESLYALEAAKGMDFKLERVALALRNLGDPQRAFKSIHIAGTNGKGSVAAMLHAVYSVGGYRAGLYTSPHLVEFRERIVVGEERISEEQVVAYARQIRAATMHGIELTFFELVTVMAFLHFARREVDIAIVEVGLGGRLDATNVIVPELSVITTISRDHEDYLGDSIESIAAEKAGIIKSKRPLILGHVPPEAGSVITTIAAEHEAPVSRLGRDFSIDGGSPTYRGTGRQIANLTLGLSGDHQRDNAAVALAVVERLGDVLPVRDDAIREGIGRVRWPGRLEVVRDKPLVVLDGAHNEAGVEALIHELPVLLGGRRKYLLFGVMRDKRWQPMVERLGPLMDGVVTVRAEAARGEDPQRLAAVFERFCPAWAADSPIDGLRRAIELAAEDGAVVVAGSLFLVGAVYPNLSQESMAGSDATRSIDAQ